MPHRVDAMQPAFPSALTLVILAPGLSYALSTLRAAFTLPPRPTEHAARAQHHTGWLT